jgi:hypothetical protein
MKLYLEDIMKAVIKKGSLIIFLFFAFALVFTQAYANDYYDDMGKSPASTDATDYSDTENMPSDVDPSEYDTTPTEEGTFVPLGDDIYD